MTTTPPRPIPSGGADAPGLPDESALLWSARQAAANAYVPYSRFPVGAALLTAGGRVVTGCNVENASFGLTICAERTAVTRMVATDARDRRIVAVAVVGLAASPCFPCGACRQVLHEFGCGRVVVEEAGGPRAYPFAEILPHGFGPDALDPGPTGLDPGPTGPAAAGEGAEPAAGRTPPG